MLQGLLDFVNTMGQGLTASQQYPFTGKPMAVTILSQSGVVTVILIHYITFVTVRKHEL